VKVLRIPERKRGRRITIYVNGTCVTAYTGETLFAVLLVEGFRILRPPVEGASETAAGGFCGMGVCQECRVTVDGVPDRRACMTDVRDGMEVVTDGR
jgi:predicted molibdopterin-dependent oxidoreductase YjgC